MKIVYVCKKPLHIHSGRTELASALSETKHDVYYIAPLRWKDYVLHRLAALTYDANFDKLNYKPYLRITRKIRWYERNTIVDILNRDRLISKDTFIISNDMDVCHELKELMHAKVCVAYHIVDRYSEYDKRTDEEKTRFDQRENEIIKKCDLVLCVSRKLLSEAQILNKQAFWFPGAVRENQIAKPSKKVSTGKIGMISNNLSRIDWPLLCSIAQQLENYKIELIGENDLPKGFCCPQNIHIIGRVPFIRLGEYVNEWDVGLALYQKNRFNAYCCPLKYFEYSSFNIPTVSTTIPEGKVLADLYPESLFLADEPSYIAEHVKNIIERDRTLDHTRLARENTWTIRAEQLCRIFENYSND